MNKNEGHQNVNEVGALKVLTGVSVTGSPKSTNKPPPPPASKAIPYAMATTERKKIRTLTHHPKHTENGQKLRLRPRRALGFGPLQKPDHLWP